MGEREDGFWETVALIVVVAMAVVAAINAVSQ